MTVVSRSSIRALTRGSIAATVVLASTLIAVLPAGAQTSGWQPGPGAAGDNTYDGFIDTPTPSTSLSAGRAFMVSGWFVDKTAEGWAGADEVQIYNGKMNEGGTMLSRALVAQPRPDVGAALGNGFWTNSGFVGDATLGQGTYQLSVYVHTPSKGWWYKQVGITVGASTSGTTTAPAPGPTTGGATSGDRPVVTISRPTKGERVSTRSDFTTLGTAVDPAGPNGVDRVDVYINGERGTQYASQVGLATISGTNWQLTFQPTKYPSIHSNLYVYARSRITGREGMATTDFDIVDNVP